MTDQNLKLAMEGAKRLAFESGRGVLDVPHLALALFQNLNEPVRGILEESCAIDVDGLAERLARTMPRGGGEERSTADLPFSSDLQEVLEDTMELRRSQGADEIRTEHLVAAILRSEHVAWRYFLEESGLDALLIADLVLERASPYIELEIEQIDVFAADTFHGNPAAVVTLDRWLPANLMQAIAAENNLSETAFTIPGEGVHHIRWFTPTQEVEFCGHATIASARVLLDREPKGPEQIRFHSSAGPLDVQRDGDRLSLLGPQLLTESTAIPEGLDDLLGCRVLEAHVGGGDLLVVVSSEAEVARLRPRMAGIEALEHRGVIVTAVGDELDFVSRFFAPRVGVPEDPATGSAHCVLAPFWAERLGKRELRAAQLSARRGDLHCRLTEDRVELIAMTHRYLRGTIRVPRQLDADAEGPRHP